MANKGGVSMGITGMETVLKRFHGLMSEIALAASGALREEADDILAMSKDNFVPVDTGALKASGVVTMEEMNGHKMPVITFGSDVVDYALVVHENPAPHHPIGQWKYLETPLTAAMSGMTNRVAARVRKEMRI